MLCAQCNQLDIGEFFKVVAHTESGTPFTRTLRFIDTRHQTVEEEIAISLGKTFGEIIDSAAEGCELCQVIAGSYTGVRILAPNVEICWYLKISENPYCVASHTSHRLDGYGPKHVGGLIFQPYTKPTKDGVLCADTAPGGAKARVNLFAEPGHILSKSGDVEHQRALVPGDASKVIKRWLHECRTKHGNCMKAIGRLPTRVIDVEPSTCSGPDQVRLIEGKGCRGEYAALSHCWGSTPINKTTKASLAAHSRGIVVSSLCKTFREAIGFCKDLGIRYLWIDALCITQDDEAEWRREAELMADLYHNATITLAATASVDGSGGLLHPREQNHHIPTLKWTKLGNTERVSFQAHDPDTLAKEVLDAPLNQRGWVLQEMLLSSRIVHFSRRQLLWHCQSTATSETHTWPTDLEATDIPFARLGALRLPAQPRVAGVDRHWELIVERYTKCQLTYQHDKLAAIAGIAKAWTQKTGDRYVAGLWERTLPVSLLWAAKDLKLPSRRLPLPTWSWTSSPFPVFWITYPTRYSDPVIDADSVQVSINGSLTQTNYIHIQEGSLSLTGYVTSGVFEPIPTLPIHGKKSMRHLYHTEYKLVLSGAGHFSISTPRVFVAEFDMEPIIDRSVFLLLVFHIGNVYINDFVILLESAGISNCYRRVGVASLDWDCSVIPAHRRPSSHSLKMERHQSDEIRKRRFEMWTRDGGKRRITIL